MTIGVRKLHSVALNVDPGQYLGGWRADAGTLFLPVLSEGRVGDEVAVRVGLFGQPIRATVFGKIAGVRRVGRPALPPGVELALDPTSLAAGQFLAAAARGERLDFQERAPRFLVERRLAVGRTGSEHQATTLNVSEGGCCLAWTGTLPLVGEVITLKLGESIFAATARAVVCWNALGGKIPRAVGVRVLLEGRAGKAWRALAAAAASSGARSA
jgi:hypothetical protein